MSDEQRAMELLKQLGSIDARQGSVAAMVKAVVAQFREVIAAERQNTERLREAVNRGIV